VELPIRWNRSARNCISQLGSNRVPTNERSPIEHEQKSCALGRLQPFVRDEVIDRVVNRFVRGGDDTKLRGQNDQRIGKCKCRHFVWLRRQFVEFANLKSESKRNFLFEKRPADGRLFWVSWSSGERLQELAENRGCAEQSFTVKMFLR